MVERKKERKKRRKEGRKKKRKTEGGKKTVTCAKISPKISKPRDLARKEEEEEEVTDF